MRPTSDASASRHASIACGVVSERGCSRRTCRTMVGRCIASKGRASQGLSQSKSELCTYPGRHGRAILVLHDASPLRPLPCARKRPCPTNRRPGHRGDPRAGHRRRPAARGGAPVPRARAGAPARSLQEHRSSRLRRARRAAAKRLGTLGNAWISEAIVAEFLGRGYYDTHLATLQRELDDRYTRCLELLRERMPEGGRRPGEGPRSGSRFR